MKKYLPVVLLAFLYGGVECSFLDELWWWKSGLMVPYWLIISAVIVGLAYLPERRVDRAMILGLFCAFVVLDAGYWFFDRFPNYPFPVYNWWGEWWPWNSLVYGYLVGEPLPLLGVPAYYFGLGLVFALLWSVVGSRSFQSKDGGRHA